MGVILDTSIWVDHLRAGVPELARLLEHNLVAVHPFIVGELACGNLARRTHLLGWLRNLPLAPKAHDQEVLYFIEEAALMGLGIGWVDVHLLASVKLGPSVKLWTLDKRLGAVAADLGLAWKSSF